MFFNDKPAFLHGLSCVDNVKGDQPGVRGGMVTKVHMKVSHSLPKSGLCIQCPSCLGPEVLASAPRLLHAPGDAVAPLCSSRHPLRLTPRQAPGKVGLPGACMWVTSGNKDYTSVGSLTSPNATGRAR